MGCDVSCPFPHIKALLKGGYFSSDLLAPLAPSLPVFREACEAVFSRRHLVEVKLFQQIWLCLFYPSVSLHSSAFKPVTCVF